MKNKIANQSWSNLSGKYYSSSTRKWLKKCASIFFLSNFARMIKFWYEFVQIFIRSFMYDITVIYYASLSARPIFLAVLIID